ncbi:MAG: YqgE/AlgH family protein [Bacteroidota bacterium]
MSTTNIKPSRGKLLIAEPVLDSVYFKKSVILITDYNDEGSVGFVLNKKIDAFLKDVITDIKSDKFQLFVGGPVAKDSLFFIHNKGELIKNSTSIGNNLYWGGDFDSIKKFINSGKLTEDDIKFFVGYSGWDANQLERELEEETWIISDFEKAQALSYRSEDMWRDALKKLGGDFSLLINYPDDPTLN